MDVPFKKKRYLQKYRTQWESEEDFKGWLRPVVEDPSKAMCSLCSVEINAKLYDIRKHADARKHRRKIDLQSIIDSAVVHDETKPQTVANFQFPLSDVDHDYVTTEPDNVLIPFKASRTKRKPSITNRVKRVEQQTSPFTSFSLTNKIKPTELQVANTLSLFIAEHNLILSVDQLTETYRIIYKNSPDTSDSQLDRTRCTEIINYVLAPHFRNLLVQDVGKQKYSIIIDESTDVSISRYLGIVIRYFSQKQKNIINSFLGLVKLETVDAKNIVNSLAVCLNEYNLPLENMIGLGTDNAPGMVGVNNGVYAILKREYNLENLVLIRCVCHSIQLAVSCASENTIPSNIEFFVREIHKWFSAYPERMEEYKEIYKLIDCGEETLTYLKVSDIRWLSLAPAVLNILAHWEELKLHFNVVRSKENCYTAEMISGMLNDDITRYYLLFLQSVFSDVQKAVDCFEGENKNPLTLLDALITLMRTICTKILTPSAQIRRNYLEDQIMETDVNPNSYLDHGFETALKKSELQEETKTFIKVRCTDFLIKLIHELQKRLPNNYKLLQKMTMLCPEEAKKPEKDLSLSELAKSFGFSDEKIDKLIEQWKIIHFEKWESTNVIQFWVEVKKYKTASGDSLYQDLCDLAFTALSLPHSNNEVKKLFTSMTTTRIKYSKRIDLPTLNSILTIRYFLNKSKETSGSYSLPPNILHEISKKKTPKLEKDSGEPNEPSTSAVIIDLDDGNIIF